MDAMESFMGLADKKKSVASILSQYDFLSALSGVFTINSWRYNRGAQESCLALNLAIAENNSWGSKTISTPDDMRVFFDQLYPHLKISFADDPVLPDFGEIKLNYKNQYYSVITGTGHTAPVFSALQFLERISSFACMDSYTEQLLMYSNQVLELLKTKNAPIDSDFSLSASFVIPTYDYYVGVRTFIESRKWLNLDERILSMLSFEYSDIVRSHFFKYEEVYYPLFNPSMIIDYQIHLINNISDDSISSIVVSALADKLFDIYNSSISTNCIFRHCLLVDGKTLLVEKSGCFSYIDSENLIIFLDCAHRKNIEETINMIQSAYSKETLSIVNLDEECEGLGYKAYQVSSKELNIICFDEYINIDENRWQLGSDNEIRIYTAIDLMYMIMYSTEISQITQFDNDDRNEGAQVFSWGGVSDFYTTFLSEKGFISKGALVFNNISFEIDTSAAFILSFYMLIESVFPFHFSSKSFCYPECWSVLRDDTETYQFTRKAHGYPCGSLFKYRNGCVVFLSFDLLGILKISNLTQARLSLDFYRSITERFFRDYADAISDIQALDNCFVQYTCRSLSEDDSNYYVICDNIINSNNHITIDIRVNCGKIEADIASSNDRTVEFMIIRELIQPLVSQSESAYSDILSRMEDTSKGKKVVNATSIQLNSYFNPNTYDINETEESELSVRKQIAIICLNAGIQPGTYERKEATKIVRAIQESVVDQFEQKLRSIDQMKLHTMILSAMATVQLSININRNSAFISKDLEESERIKSLEKSTQLYEEAKSKKAALIYLLESNLFVSNDRGDQKADEHIVSELLSYAKWLTVLQNSSDLCFHTDSDTALIVMDDFRIDVALGEHYSQVNGIEKKRRILSEPYELRYDEADKRYVERIMDAFYQDTGVKFKVLEAVLHQLSDCSFSREDVHFEEVAPNVISINALDAIHDYSNFVVEETPEDEVKRAYEYLTVLPQKLKNIADKQYPILPVWEREKRDNCLSVKPIVSFGNNFIYSPIVMEELRTRWRDGLLQFYPPYEIGLDKTCCAIYEWKNHYEHLISSDVEKLFKDIGCDYAKHDIDLRREDRNGNHPTINELGDYDAIGLNLARKEIYLVECKVLRPIGSVFEHSNQQKRFFLEEKFDEKFQHRIDYFNTVSDEFFASQGFINTKGFKILPYMVVNKVFSSYYKHIEFPIVTYGELKQMLADRQ